MLSWHLPSEFLTTSMSSSCCKYVQYILRITKWHLSHFGNYSPWYFDSSKLSFGSGSCKTQDWSFGKLLPKPSCPLSLCKWAEAAEAGGCVVHPAQWQMWAGPKVQGCVWKSLDVSGCVWMSLDVSAALCGMLHSMVAALLRALESTTSAEILAWKCESISLRIRTPGLLVSWIYHSAIWPYPWLCSWRCTSRCSQSRWLGWEFLPRITTGNTK